MLWAMYDQPIFMSVVPNTFYNNGGAYPVKTLVTMVLMMLAFTWAGDLVFVMVNYFWGQRLPVIYTWRRIKDGRWAYLGFLTYALTTMGVMFNFNMMLLLPRAAYCASDNYCDCSLKSYRAVCNGEYISMLVDYLLPGVHG